MEKLGERPCLIRHWQDVSLERVAELDPLAIIHSGGKALPAFPDEPIFRDRPYQQLVTETPYPQLAICRAFQVITTIYGGKAGVMPNRPGLEPRNGYFYETGLHRVFRLTDDPIFRGVSAELTVHENHRNEVTVIPPGFILLARNDACEVQAWRHPDRVLYGMQFHPERNNTNDGRAILRAFFDIAARAAKGQAIGGPERHGQT